MALIELDSLYTRAIKHLHSSAADSQYYLGSMLDEVIKNAYGSHIELGGITNLPCLEYPIVSTICPVYDSITADIKEESKTCSSSDNELELDLLKEDLACIVCKSMDVAAKNQLLECCECHSLYHQECHEPIILQDEIESHSPWVCNSCKLHVDTIKGKLNFMEKNIGNISSVHDLSNITQNFYPDRDAPECTLSKNTNPKSIMLTINSVNQSLIGNSSNVVNRMMTPNISIICADKRLQTMKKKAAKMQEKRKLNNK